MEPDAQTRVLLEGMAASGAPPLYEMAVNDARAALKALTLSVDAPFTDVAEVDERDIPGADSPVNVRVYRPGAGAGDLSPLLLLCHGGGYALGDLDTHDHVARFLCSRGGVVVVSVDYRLAPEHKFPAGVEDAYAALCWASSNAGELGADAARIAVGGDSAGGNFSAALCLMAMQRGGPPIALQVLAYPAVDQSLHADYPSRTRFGGGEYMLSQKDIEWLSGMYFTDQAREGNDLRASPMLAEDLRGLPPALIITAGFDPLRDEGEAYARRLREAGVAVEYHCFEGTIHGFLSFSGALDAGVKGLELIAAALKQRLGS